ncbi:hypothetical protein SAMN02745163_02254 [Clostridium cavendishii DSM 21758]|uniref:Pyridoxal phosphate homeostasis protein n=1 Tax=Clostridium cavendishii DSM 21758 TaxID=1121302 RepID=A0A1M6KNT5_9CLOT|nr:YggS family pyridoxal phosphate-dependent enzyme [Clostridium cavendishii]SHJ60673.1 hypothetical protein SAMN02745163_02254 [Clostridium cavendishii DSM 21758]
MDIKNNLINIEKSIPKDVKLVAVSKYKPIEMLQEAYEAGIRDFGENKVQELQDKYDKFHKDVKWHFIGHLQTNKVKYIVGKVNLIHSLDSVKLLNELEKNYKNKDIIADVLIQINIGREENKYGILEEELISLIEEVEKCSFVKVKGLMAILPKGDEVSNREYFKRMYKIWSDMKAKNFKNITMEILSMGMSNDYKIAIEEGANMVRVGQGIFGKRD